MAKSVWIFCYVIGFFISSSYCYLASSRGGSCLVPGLSFGGRLSLPHETLDIITDSSPCPAIGERIFIFQIPRKFSKTNKRLLKLGLFGVGRMWVSKDKKCWNPTRSGNLQCRAPEDQSIPCLDKGIPCYVDMRPPKYSLLRFDANKRVTVVLPENFTTPGIEGYKIEYRKANSAELITEEIQDIRPKQLNDTFDEGVTYEMTIHLRYGDLYCKPPLFQTFTMPCRDVVIDLELSTSFGENDMARVRANWRFHNLTGQCSVINQTVSLEQIDLDHCAVRSTSMRGPETLKNDTRSYMWNGMKANTEYRVNVTVNMRDKPYTTGNLIRTLETAPSAPPKRISLSTNYRARQVYIRWKSPPCGKRNGQIMSYNVEMTRNGERALRNVTETQVSYHNFKRGDRFSFRVAAINSRGIGPYTSKIETRFGYNLF